MKDCENCRHYYNNGKGDENCDVRGWDFVKEDCPDFDNRFFRNRAEWIEHGEPNAFGKYEQWYWTCGNCGGVGFDKFRFCPACGARMVNDDV